MRAGNLFYFYIICFYVIRIITLLKKMFIRYPVQTPSKCNIFYFCLPLYMDIKTGVAYYQKETQKVIFVV